MFSINRAESAGSSRRLAAIGSIAVVVAMTASACGSSSSSNTNNTSGDEKKGLKVGVVMLQGDTYFQGIEAGLRDAVKADGGTVTTGLSNNDPATESQVVQNMIQAKMDVIAMQPAATDASLPAMKAIKAAGISLVCYGNCTSPNNAATIVDGVIQSDNTALGTSTGAAAAKYFKSKGKTDVKIAILNCDVASACKLRKAGFKKALADGGIKATYVTDQEAYLADKATGVTQGILTAHSDIDAIWASNDGGTTGAVTAVKQASKKLPVFGTDISTQLAQMLLASDDILQATTGQDPTKTAQGAYDMAKKAHDGGKNTPFEVDLPGILYDRSNPAATNTFLGKK